MPANYTSPHSYGSVSDKFYTIRFLKFIFNTDEQAVLDAEYFAFYKGQLVIREDWAFTNGRSGSFIIMFLNSNETDVNTVRHKWGHFVQLLQLGIVEYTFSILLPSVLSDPYNKHYYSNPWEITADIYGVTNRNYTYLNGSAVWGYA